MISKRIVQDRFVPYSCHTQSSVIVPLAEIATC